MSDEVNPIKDYLFDYIEKSNNIENLHTGNFNLKEGEYIITIVPKKD